MAKKRGKKSGGAQAPKSGKKSGGAPAPKSGKKAAAGRPAVKGPKATDGMTGAQKVVWFSLLAMVFMVPLAMSNANWIGRLMPSLAQTFSAPLTYDQFDIVKVFVMRACALVGFGAWAFDFFLRGGKLRRTKADWLILILLGWILLTSFTSIHPATAFFGKYRRFEGWLSFLTYAVTFFLVTQIVDRPSRIRSLTATLMVSAGIVSGYGVLQYAGLDPINWGSVLPFEFNRAFATFGNPDLLGGFIIFPLVMCPAMALSEKRLGWRIAYWLVFFITVVTWITAFVRGAWLGGGLGLIIVTVAIIRARPSLEVPDYVAGGATALAGVGVIARSAMSPVPVLNFFQRFMSIFEFGAGSAKTRFEIWDAAVNATKARPILGFGADTFRLVFPKYKPLAYTHDAGYISVADNVHNYPLQMASAIGVPGVLLLYATFGWILWLAAPNAFAKDKGSERLVITGFWAAAIGYITHLMTGLSVTGSTIFLWIAFAIVLTPLATITEVKPPAWGPLAAIIALAVSVAGFVGNGVYIVADNYYLRGQFGIVSPGRTAVDELKTAVALNPYNDMYRSEIGKAYMDQMNGWLQEASRLQQAGQDPSAASQNAYNAFRESVAAYEDVMRFVPTEYDNYVFLSALYNQAGQYFDPRFFNDAIRVAKEGQRAEPFGPLVRFQEATALYHMKREAEAVKVLEVAVKQDWMFLEARMMLADLYERHGEYSKAAGQYQFLLLANANDANARAKLMKYTGAAATQGPIAVLPQYASGPTSTPAP